MVVLTALAGVCMRWESPTFDLFGAVEEGEKGSVEEGINWVGVHQDMWV